MKTCRSAARASRREGSRFAREPEIRRKPTRATRAPALEALEARVLLHGSEPQLTDHYHPFLEIQLEGERVPLPANIGVGETGVIDVVHTHDSSGLLHIHPFGGQPTLPEIPTIGRFFDVWRTNAGLAGNNPNAIFNSGQILDRVADGTHAVRMFVNGAANDQFENYRPRDGDQILISFEAIAAAGSPTLVPIGAQTMASGKALDVPLDGFDPEGGSISFTASSSNANVTATVLTGNRSLRLSVSVEHVDGHTTTGVLTIELYEDLAPRTTARIIELVQAGFYNGLTFHRLINDFMIQGGDPLGNGTGGTGIKFDDEFSALLTFGGYGQAAMANSGDDSNDSQIFLTDLDLRLTQFAEAQKSPPQHLTFNHTIFGQVTSGFDVFQSMMLAAVSGSSPLRPIRILSAEVFEDTENGVVRLEAAAGFTGSATITVTAADPTGLVIPRSFVVQVVADTVNDRPFLGPLSNQTTTVNTPLELPLTAVDLENDTLTFAVRHPNNFFGAPANAVVTINQSTRIATVQPAPDFIGTIQMRVAVRDQTDRNGNAVLDELSEFDTQIVTITVEPIPGTIGGRKFHDLDGDGTDDGGLDPGLEGWTIELDRNADGTVDATTQTAADGSYVFENLAPGTYRVREVDQNGFVRTTANPADILITATGSIISGVNFGNFQTFTIQGRKFEDHDGDGNELAGIDQGLAGWVIFLDHNGDGLLNHAAAAHGTCDAGALEPCRVTDSAGEYQFTGLGPGSYRVREVLQPGWIRTTINIPNVQVLSGQDLLDFNFGNFRQISISGVKFDDLNGNGVRDDGEPGLANWTIELDARGDGTVDATTTTAADGSYQFDNIGPGLYRVREVSQAGWQQTTADPADITASSGVDVAAVDFGNFRQITISGRTFRDLDNDGTDNGGSEPGLAGWTIELDAGADGTVDATTQTNVDGAYAFTSLGPGLYRIREVAQVGYTQTTANPPDILASSGSNVASVDFGNHIEAGAIRGIKFQDFNGDGVRDEDEPALAGWEIQLDFDADGSIDATTTTDAAGMYAFTGLLPGTYRVREAARPGWMQSTPDPADVDIADGDLVENVDFGNFQLVRISGLKYHDHDGNGLRDAEDERLEGWTIFIDSNGDGVLNHPAGDGTCDGAALEPCTVTNASGEYEFGDLGPGVYRVREVAQPGWAQSTPDPAPIAARSGIFVSGIDFGNSRVVTIHGRKFDDVNGDGDDGGGVDPGLEGWTIFLDTNGNDQLDDGEPFVVTDASGQYAMTSLLPGRFRVREVHQAGFVATRSAPAEFDAATGEVVRLDFGNFRMVAISGRKFDDLDGDGSDNGGTEPGLSGWTIFLDSNENGQLDEGEQSTVTAADGTYQFSDLGPGIYRVRELPRAGWRHTTSQPHDIQVTSGSNTTGVDLGNFQLPSIHGAKFEDILGDGFSLDDLPLEGWTVELYLDDGDGQFDASLDTRVGDTISDAAGRYQFIELAAGTYFVREVLQDEWVQTAGAAVYTIVVDGSLSGEVHADNDFGNFQLFDIIGFKLNDVDGNGVADDAQFSGLGGWTIFLDINNNGELDDGEPTTVTQGFGNYAFTNLGPGTHRLREVLQPGWIQVAGDRDVIGRSGVDVSQADFLNFQLISIRGAKFHDLNGDGLRQPSEQGLANWTVFLDSNGNGELDAFEVSATTAADGTYEFAGLGPGRYIVRELRQPGWLQATPPPAAIDARSGSDVSNVSFGNFQLITLRGRKFHDVNGNGVQDLGEPGLEGWTVFIDENLNGAHDPNELVAVSGADGNYQIEGVGPGPHRVLEVLQDGWTQTRGNPVPIEISSGQDLSGVDFGNFQLITISGRKFDDFNGDGERDNGEAFVPGVTIFIDSNRNGQLDPNELRTQTDAAGNYQLTGVGPGTHRVLEVLPAGTVQTTAHPAEIEATSGQDVSGIDFGNFRLVTIGGRKFNDLDGDGERDPGEPGLAGWTIYVDANDNGILDDNEIRTVSGQDGSYALRDLGPGSYRVREVPQAGFVQTRPAPTLFVIHIAASGRNLENVDFGNFALISISGRKFMDVNQDGVLGAGEFGLGGWTIYIDRNGNGTLDADEPSTVTDSSGNYSFTQVGPGSHVLREVLAPGWRQTAAPAAVVARSGGSVTGRHFGNVPLGSAMSIQDPDDPSRTSVIAFGTDGADRLSVRSNGNGRVLVMLDGREAGRFEATGRIMLYGFDGDDRISCGRNVRIPCELRGGDGNDTLWGARGNDVLEGGAGDDELHGRGGDDAMYGDEGADRMRGGNGHDMLRGGDDNDKLRGGRGNDMLLGEDADDRLEGGGGRDMLIGGDGADKLRGDRADDHSRRSRGGGGAQRGADRSNRNRDGRNEDILIGGTTNHDVNDEALQLILEEWTSRRPYQSRVAHLQGSPGQRLNGQYLLDSFNVFDDDARDTIRGGAGQDWVLGANTGINRDRIVR